MLRCLCPAFAAVFLCILLLPGYAGATSTRVTVASGTAVPVEVVDKISSATANVGDTFAIQTASDVIVNGWVVIAKGAQGQGEVLSVERAGKHGKAGTLGLQMDWIRDVAGQKIKLTSEKKTQEGESKTGESSTVTIISAAVLGIPGLFAHNFVKGKDVELDASQVLQSFVDSSV
jgi:hypothetical protein